MGVLVEIIEFIASILLWLLWYTFLGIVIHWPFILVALLVGYLASLPLRRRRSAAIVAAIVTVLTLSGLIIGAAFFLWVPHDSTAWYSVLFMATALSVLTAPLAAWTGWTTTNPNTRVKGSDEIISLY